MNYHGYTVDSSFLSKDGRSIEWKVTGTGEYILARRGAFRYFLKRVGSVRHPDAALKRKMPSFYEKQLAAFEAFKSRREKIDSSLPETEWKYLKDKETFVDSDGRLVSVAPFLEKNVVLKPKDFPKMGQNGLLALFERMASSLAYVHSNGIVHSDVKPANFIIRKLGGSHYPTLIDFDCAFPVDQVPERDNFAGSDAYLAPEASLYFNGESEGKDVSSKIDSFSLGVAIHVYLTGKVPSSSFPSPADALNSGFPIGIDEKLKSIPLPKEGTMYELVEGLLERYPDDRLACSEASDILCGKLNIHALRPEKGEVKEEKGGLLPEDAKYFLVSDGYSVAESEGFYYAVRKGEDPIGPLKANELCRFGILSIKDKDRAWDDDPFSLVDRAKQDKLGVVVERHLNSVGKRMYVVKMGSSQVVYDRKDLVSSVYVEGGKPSAKTLGGAKSPTAIELDPAGPLEGEGWRFDERSIQKAGYLSVHRSGDRYLVRRNDGTWIIINSLSARILGIVKKKEGAR